MLSKSEPSLEKQKPTLSPKQKRKQDALELAELIYEMYSRPDKIEVEQKD